MRIACGLDGGDGPAEIANLVGWGADEFFAGYVPRQWSEFYGWEIGLNRRTFGATCQYTTAESLKEAIDAVHRQNRRIAITFNAHDYSQAQVPFLQNIVEETERMNPDAYIVADPAFIQLLKSWGVSRPLHLSTGVGCYNSESVRFFLETAPVRRTVIPRKMSLQEMETFIHRLNDTDVEYEVMIIGYRCIFNDEFCFSWHTGAEMNLCSWFVSADSVTTDRFPDDWKDTVDEIVRNPQEQVHANSTLDNFLRRNQRSKSEKIRIPYPAKDSDEGMTATLANKLINNCGLCAIPRLKKIGVDVLKVPVRGHAGQKRLFLQLVRKVVDHPDPTPDYCRKLLNSPEFCSTPGSCYYEIGKQQNGGAGTTDP